MLLAHCNSLSQQKRPHSTLSISWAVGIRFCMCIVLYSILSIGKAKQAQPSARGCLIGEGALEILCQHQQT